MPAIDRIDVWIGVAGVLKKNDLYLVVKKTYGGLKDKWSFPAGFVDPGETIEQAVIREVKEETGIDSEVHDILGIRTGVIKNKISDNMIIFLLKYVAGEIEMNQDELKDARWLSRDELLSDPNTSSMIRFFLEEQEYKTGATMEGFEGNPGPEFGYTEYKIFRNKYNLF